MNFNKSLSHEDVHLQIMTKGDFNRLFAVAKDPEIWINIMIKNDTN